MKKIGRSILWFFAVIFILAGFGMFSESVLAGISMVLFGLSLCPLIWKIIQSRFQTKRWMKIIAPIVLFIAAMSTAPTVSPNEPATGTINTVQVESTFAETKAEEVTVAAMTSAETEAEIVETTQETKEQLDELTVHFINVGQGDATLITCGDNSMLIDAGDNSKGSTVQLYLQKQGISKLDYLIGTHPDSDHIGGLDVVITKFDCGTIIMPDYAKDTATYRDVIDAMSYKRYKNTLPVVGQEYELGDAKFTIIAPSKKYSDPNDNSVGIILKHGDKKFLFTGDAEEEAENDILSTGIDIGCDVYQVGHHGSNTSSSVQLLDAAHPEYAIISCGEGNSYGHPRAETLNNFRSRGIKIYRTDEQGTIIAKSDGTTVTFDESPSTSWIAGEPTGGQVEGTTETTIAVTEAPVQEPERVSITYILNTSSMKFHRPSCGSLPTKNRKDSNLSRDEIISQGYEPCKKCNP